jgi:hypothetical protein
MSRRSTRRPEDLLTATQAAAYLGLTPQDVCYHCQRGNLPAEKVARVWILRWRDVKGWKPRPPGRPKAS